MVTSPPHASDSSRLWQAAASFAARAHAGQYRKDGRTPYVAHPVRVALTVRNVFGCEDVTAQVIALLHDTIEDTTTDYDDIHDQFGPAVAEGVACLTKDKRLPDDTREAAFYDQIARGSWQARLVKLADAYDNICDAATPAARSKAASKGQHAIVAAGNDPRLAAACKLLGDLIAQAEATP